MKKYQITYFPYIYLNRVDEIKLMNVRIWNYDRRKNAEIKSTKLIKKTDDLIQLNRAYSNKPINNIGILSIINKDDFAPFTSKDFEKIREFSILLFLISLAEMPRAMNIDQITSDNFTFVTQNFTLESENSTVSVSAGRIIRISNMGGEILFHKPHYVNSRTFVELDKSLKKVLPKIKKIDKKLFRRIIRATESIMNSYYNGDNMSDMSRILEIARSFEILFNLPNSQQRKHFKTKIRELFQGEYNKNRKFKSERRTGFDWEIDIKQVMWADRFYTLRNHIIHGKKIKNRDFKFESQVHLFLGVWFFLIAVKKIINKSLNKKIFYDTIIFNAKEKLFKYEDNMMLKIMDQQYPVRNILDK